MRRLAALIVIVVWASAARADTYFGALAAAVRARLDAEHVKTPPLVAPVRIDVKWKPLRIGSLELGAPLVALVAGDLDGDGKSELYAVTPREIVAYAMERGKPHEIGRVAFTGEHAVPAPRDVVGTAIVDGDGVIATVSTRTTPLRAHWAKKTLVAEPSAPGFALCRGEPRVTLVPGRDFFVGQIYGAKCRDDLVDPEGHALHVRATLSTASKLSVVVERCAPQCARFGEHEYANVGMAFEIADVDRDGRPEIIVSGAGAPGDPDAVKVLTFGDDEKKPVFRKPFVGGVVGLVELDGMVIVATRLLDATRGAAAPVDLWRLN